MALKSAEETHEFAFPKIKPSSAEIAKMVKNHFDSQAKSYDNFDASSEKRTKYTEAVNRLIADDLISSGHLGEILSIACGTGRREKEIQKLAGGSFTFTGVELSLEMTEVARKRGMECFHSSWLDFEPSKTYSALFYLYAFGALANPRERQLALKKAAQVLKAGGALYIDVLNIEDDSEWGPDLKKEFHSKRLSERGYDIGDLFYRKKGETPLSFWHYFSTEEITGLIHKAGLQIDRILYIGYSTDSGKIVGQNAGAIFLKATKK